MNKNFILAILASGIVAACSTSDTQTAARPTPDDFPLSNTPIRDENGDIDMDAIRCQREVTGSRLPGRRVCMSERNWAQTRDAGQRTLDEIQRTTQCPPDQC